MAKPKWEKLKGKYDPRPLTDEGGFREKVDKARKEHEAAPLENLLLRFQKADEEKEEREQDIKDLNVTLEALDQLIREKLGEQDLRSVTDERGHSYTVKIEPYVSIKDKIAFEKFMAEHPQLDYLWAIQPKSLAGYVKDLLDQGRDAEVPPSVSIFLKSSIQLKRSKA